MEYINYLTEQIGKKSKNYKTLFKMIRNSKILNILKKKGYKVIHFGSGYGGTIRNKYADIYIDSGRINEFSITIIKVFMH